MAEASLVPQSAAEAGEISVRRATLSDYEAVVNMMEVYRGFDYLPTFYYIFLQSKQHAVYVAECVRDHKPVGLINFRLHDDGCTAFPLTGRVHPDFQGRGVTHLIWAKFLQDFPSISQTAFDGVLSPESEKRLKNEKAPDDRRYYWNLLVYRMDNASLHAWASSDSSRQQRGSATGDVDRHAAAELTAADINDASVNGIAALLRQFSPHYVTGAHATWCPTALDDERTSATLKSQLLMTRTFVSNCTEPACLGTAKRRFSAVSFQYSYILKTKRYPDHVITQTFNYCNKLDELASHVRAQLRHLANVSDMNGRDLVIGVHFPLAIDVAQVKNFFVRADADWSANMATFLGVRKNYLAGLDHGVRSTL